MSRSSTWRRDSKSLQRSSSKAYSPVLVMWLARMVNTVIIAIPFFIMFIFLFGSKGILTANWSTSFVIFWASVCSLVTSYYITGRYVNEW